MHTTRRLTFTLALVLLLSLALFASLSQAAPSNPNPFPDPNTNTAPTDATISLTYDENLDAATVNTGTFAVHAFQTGLLTGTFGVSGNTILVTPTRPFFPGELVQTTATTRTLSITGEQPLLYTVWGFLTVVRVGSGMFNAHPISPDFGGWGSNSHDVALGDLDGDGDLDAIVANANGQAQQVFLNDGTGAFDAHPISPTFGAGDSYDVELGDLDGDGDLDAVIANAYGATPQGVYLNDGSGTFSAHPISPTFGPSDDSRAIALGDVDGDGDLDAVVANLGAAQEVYFNDGSGAFAAHSTSPAFGAGSSHDVALGDVDGDGDLDAVVANYGAPQEVYLNDGSGFFAAHPVSPTFGAGSSYAIALGDVDGDGDLDAFVANYYAAQTVYLNDGDGKFRIHPNSPLFPWGFSYDVDLGDLDGDGDLDAIVANYGDMMYQEAQYVYLNDGDGVFDVHPISPTFGLGHSLAVDMGDVDNDGDLDVVIANNGEPQTVWLNQSYNVAPEAADDSGAEYSTDEDTAFSTGNVLDNDDDANNDTLIVLDFDVSGILGLVSDNGDGTFDYDPNGQFENLGAGQQAVDAFTYVISDGELTDTATVSITITGLDDPPTASDDSGAEYTTDEDTAFVTGNVLDNDEDPDTALVVGSFDTSGTLGLVSYNGDGTFDYDPSGQFDYLDEGEQAFDSFSYVIGSGAGTLADGAVVTITINGVSDAPVAQDDGGAEYSTDEDTAFSTGNVLANDSGLFLFIESFDASGALGLVSNNGDGSFDYNPNGQFEGLGAGQQAFDAFTYVVSNGSLTDSATVSIRVSGVNDAPSANDDSDVTPYNTPLTIAVLNNDSDPEGDALSMSAVGLPANGQAAIAGNSVVYTSTQGFSGWDSFTYTVSDGELSDTATVSVQVQDMAGYQVFLPLVIRGQG